MTPVVTRKGALALGLRHYFTGIPCKNGHASKRGVRNHTCMECHRISQAKKRASDPGVNKRRYRSYMSRNPEKARASTKAWRENNHDLYLAQTRAALGRRRDADPKKLWVISAISGAKARARKGGFPFSITKDQLLSLCHDICPALGVPLVYYAKTGRGPGPNSASLDKIIPSLGYVMGNVVILSHRANSIKRDSTATELAAISSWLTKVTSEVRDDPAAELLAA